MKRILLCLLTAAFAAPAFAAFEMEIACKAAAAGMPMGNGATVYYPNGHLLTSAAGQAGATWYYSSGRVLTTSIGTVGAALYYSNGQVFSNSAGIAGSTWFYDNGQIITSSAPALTPTQIARLACQLIVGN